MIFTLQFDDKEARGNQRTTNLASVNEWIADKCLDGRWKKRDI